MKKLTSAYLFKKIFFQKTPKIRLSKCSLFQCKLASLPEYGHKRLHSSSIRWMVSITLACTWRKCPEKGESTAMVTDLDLDISRTFPWWVMRAPCVVHLLLRHLIVQHIDKSCAYGSEGILLLHLGFVHSATAIQQWFIRVFLHNLGVRMQSRISEFAPLYYARVCVCVCLWVSDHASLSLE